MEDPRLAPWRAFAAVVDLKAFVAVGIDSYAFAAFLGFDSSSAGTGLDSFAFAFVSSHSFAAVLPSFAGLRSSVATHFDSFSVEDVVIVELGPCSSDSRFDSFDSVVVGYHL